MTRPVIMIIDDFSEILNALTNNLKQRYGDRFRIIGITPAQEMLDQLKLLSEQSPSSMTKRSKNKRIPQHRSLFLSALSHIQAG